MTEQVKFRVRTPGLLAQLRESAFAHGRTLSAECCHRLEQSFQRTDIVSAVRDAVREEMHRPMTYTDAPIEWNTPERAMQTFRGFFVTADTEQSRMDYSNQ
jgi:hypothetical protein